MKDFFAVPLTNLPSLDIIRVLLPNEAVNKSGTTRTNQKIFNSLLTTRNDFYMISNLR